MAYRYGRKKKHGYSKKMTIPVAVAMPVAMRMIDTGKDMMAGKYDEAAYVLTGYNPKRPGGKGFDMGRLIATWGPVVAGLAVHKAANIFGLNRMLARHKIPLVRV